MITNNQELKRVGKLDSNNHLLPYQIKLPYTNTVK